MKKNSQINAIETEMIKFIKKRQGEMRDGELMFWCKPTPKTIPIHTLSIKKSIRSIAKT